MPLHGHGIGSAFKRLFAAGHGLLVSSKQHGRFSSLSDPTLEETPPRLGAFPNSASSRLPTAGCPFVEVWGFVADGCVGAVARQHNRVCVEHPNMRSSMLRRMVGKSPPSKPVAPGPPGKSVSPVNSKGVSCTLNDIDPGVWPGVW